MGGLGRHILSGCPGGPWLWPGPQGPSPDSRTGSLAAEEIPEQRQGKA